MIGTPRNSVLRDAAYETEAVTKAAQRYQAADVSLSVNFTSAAERA
jgi:hypothetical protein